MTFLVPESNESKDFGRIGEGTFPARVVQIIGLGRQENLNWKTKQPMLDDNGKPQPPRDKVKITLELPTELINIGNESKPRWISKDYTLTYSDKGSLSKVMKAAIGDSRDLEELLGAAVLVTVGTTSGGKDKIMSVSPIMKGMEVPELVNEPVIFNFSDPDMEVYNTLPDFIKDTMSKAVNFRNSALFSALNPDAFDEEHSDDVLELLGDFDE